ncbi:uncharacterized protein PAC_13899 [Phialocephala subalpina]|uniref:MOSC domain-containing protein n=1 Tax=Phialocephala subalpina TaxID=576137 RepID=A0A1L7XG51_9HELO|nr:uncharacterized protein PAC_13899 [Phialocephala subalpina]
MKITQLNIYPIKSLRPISLTTATLCPQGLAHDRRYILLKPKPDGTYGHMFVGIQTEMALFHCSPSTPSSFNVSYRIPTPPVASPSPAQNTTLEIPYEPDIKELSKIAIELHTDSTYPAYQMQEIYNTWFSRCFGYDVILAYIGDSLGVPKDDAIAQSWKLTIKSQLPSSTSPEAITFSDGAALLVVSEASLNALHPLVGEKVVLEKFRPNIVLSCPSLPAWDEDLWSSLTLPNTGIKILLTSNCSRCMSINVDLERGKMGTGPSGSLLKKMMRERRVDLGNKWTPIFGRYGFPVSGGEIRVGDEVLVGDRLEKTTVWNGVMPRLSKFGEVTS